MSLSLICIPQFANVPLERFEHFSLKDGSVSDVLLQVSDIVSIQNYSWVAVVSAPVVFDVSAGELISEYLKLNPQVDLIYADSRKVKRNSGLNLRTDYCSERLRSQNYLGPVVFYTSDLLLTSLSALQGNNLDLPYALALEASHQAREVGHLSKCIYTEKVRPGTLTEEELRSLSDTVSHYFDQHGGGVVDGVTSQGVVLSRRVPHGEPLVSIVIPTRGIYSEIDGSRFCYVVDAVRSICDKSTYTNFEFVIVVDAVAETEVLQQLEEIAGSKLRIVTWTKPFNFSEKMNYGVLHAAGEFVLLLNDDVEVISPDWLGEMLALAQLPHAGMVGAMLYYGDDTIQHAGHAYFEGSPTHIGLGLPRGASGPDGGFLYDRRVSGVTAACALMRQSIFREVGGFTALLPGNFNDVDLCLKVGWLGYHIYWTPRAELYHFESKTRDAHVHYYELDVIEHRWGLRLNDSRFWRGHPWAAG